MKIGVMGAMEEEIEPFLKENSGFTKLNEEEYGQNIYHIGSFDKHEIVLAYSKIGKVNAALTAATMIEKYGVNLILFTGVAGAVNKDLKIGDLIAAKKLCQHDLDITAFGHKLGYVPGGAVYVNCDEKILSLAHKVATKKGLRLSDGIIATGDQFVSSSEVKDKIAKIFDADAIEMEGAAVAVVCDALNIPFFILRAISDAADMDATFDFDTFLKESSKVSSSFIASLLKEI
ncbi:MAG: 5'-methylthioadenosine/adenosylhomocysteine nucleosidase [Sulfurospirillaceae bacterium]|jgi:adenosylhomocysteine/aminodeoxyfutalosine nucleosidase|nr:5'-methylthioadenosine/adenosylhomocysteine nucleosidase [Sulfurospirillaceae bacterium]MCK9545317.1 5'-methylthioadenosine/adenosylhomocysteine nucleosidase [Sulfurospirillaceae bacterium]MDY0238430.1 5'-methylthioadenosine/adenosylhomocysteine nucleosidase [Campylobacterales bacterium]NLM98559.1 5'-methylthioadenosine/adenosylhomocysteine nucleosidase [Campylobacteraceae bacterium]